MIDYKNPDDMYQHQTFLQVKSLLENLSFPEAATTCSMLCCEIFHKNGYNREVFLARMARAWDIHIEDKP